MHFLVGQLGDDLLKEAGIRVRPDILVAQAAAEPKAIQKLPDLFAGKVAPIDIGAVLQIIDIILRRSRRIEENRTLRSYILLTIFEIIDTPFMDI